MEDVTKRIHDYALEEIMGIRFGRYSKYIIQDRAIPDVRDGLKPVQRRILFSMFKNGTTFDKEYVKCAKTVGDVIGKYHPHGDTSVYDAMVRMSQDWKQRHTYIDFQGNNGSIDGDSAAAYRYTEAKLSKLSNEILRDINKNTVEMTYNFDDTLLEPTVMPCRFPNLLLNGCTGISAGYATNIPPHNLSEIIDATIKRIDSPNSRLETIMEIVKGPDFPTGGIVENLDGLKSAYETGRGKIIVRSRYNVVKEKGKPQIVITEIPYDVNKALLVHKIDEIRIDKKIDGMLEVRDESDKDGLRIAIDLKQTADANLIINYLLKNTDLQISYNYNMVAIVNRRPKQLGILPILDAYIEHQKDVVTKRTQFDLAFAEKELHITEGLVKALSILDEVIATIRRSSNKSNAIENLVKEYDFTNEQATAIVMLQLYKLTNTDVTELNEKLANLRKVIDFLRDVLADPEKLNGVIKDELRSIKKEFYSPRRTEISDTITEIKIAEEDLIVKENVIVSITNDGYIKKVSLKSYNTATSEDKSLKPGDYITGLYEVSTLDTILVFTSMGHYLYIPVFQIPDCKWNEVGKHVSNIVLIAPNEKVIGSVIYKNNNVNVIQVTKLGMIKRSNINDFVVSRYSKPITSMKLKDNDEVISVDIERKNIFIVTKNGYYLNFLNEEVPVVSLKAAGVKGIALKDDEVVSACTYSESDQYINIFTNKNTAKRIKIDELANTTRAKKGSTIIKKVKSVSYNIMKAFVTDSKNDIGLRIDEEIKIIKNSEIPIMDLISTGSVISKKDLKDVFDDKELKSFIKNFDNNKNAEDKKEEKVESEEVHVKQVTFDDFIEDFRL